MLVGKILITIFSMALSRREVDEETKRCIRSLPGRHMWPASVLAETMEEVELPTILKPLLIT